MTAERIRAGSGRRLAAAVVLVLVAGAVSGCAVGGVGMVVEAARESFADEMSPRIKRELSRLQEMPYAQLYARFPDREEAVFLLAEQNPDLGQDLWIGSGGVSLAMEGPNIRYTQGLSTDITASESVRDGAVALHMKRKVNEVLPTEASVLWLHAAAATDWLEQIGTIERVQEVYYQGFAYTGPAIRVSERVRTTGKAGSFRRVFWIEPRTRSLLRMETRIWPESRPIVLEWVRVPNRADAR